MKFISSLTASDQAALEQLHREGATHRQRQRAQAVLLSAKGYTLEQLAQICVSDRGTVSRWLNNWQAHGLNGLADAPRIGRRRKINAALEEALLEMLENPSPNLKALVLDDLKKKESRLSGTRSSEPCAAEAARSAALAVLRPKHRQRSSNTE